MRKILFAVLAALALASPAMAQHDRFNDPDYPGVQASSPYVLVGGFWYYPHRGVNVPVLDMRRLDEPQQRWIISRLSERRWFAAEMLARTDRWELLGLSCSEEGCGISFNSIYSGNGGRALGFAVYGDPTRVGKRGGFLGLGGRRSIGIWTRTYFVADKAVREALLMRALYR